MKLYGLTWGRLENAINTFFSLHSQTLSSTFCVICITHDLHARLIDITLWSMLHNSPWHGGKVFPNKMREKNVDLQREITMWLHRKKKHQKKWRRRSSPQISSQHDVNIQQQVDLIKVCLWTWINWLWWIDVCWNEIMSLILLMVFMSDLRGN